MVYRIFVEKKLTYAHESKALLTDVNKILGINNLSNIRLLNRYDAENITKDLFDYAVKTVFSEPQTDDTYENFDDNDATVFAVEYLPGQFDQRADSASQCIQINSEKERPIIRSAKVYALYGDLTDNEIAEIKKYVINPVEAREASLLLPTTIKQTYDIPKKVKVLDDFLSLDRNGLAEFVKTYGLAMDTDDIAFCQEYFKSEKRNPTITEIRMIDTYWSDHCRHTTFLTNIDNVKFDDKLLEDAYNEYIKIRKDLGVKKPVTLMNIATLAVKYLKACGKLPKLDESEEINACTVKIEVEADGKKEPWLLLFKNETHNHPTEIEPFGGAATCIGGAIRDPLSGRSYVYGAMRVTGAADPTVPVSETLPGKLPQRKIVQTAAAGYSSYGNQIGLATGVVDEIYHPGYAAKRMEIGAVIAATPAENVRREVPNPGDIVILLGGSTGRDGIGGATGSSKAHTTKSVEVCGAEVQKGNAPEERKLQRLFRNQEACKMIKRSNNFAAGGVSVAIGELADGLLIDLNKVPKKYEGLDGTELAISESQERMAVVIEKENVDKFMAIAEKENLNASLVAVVTEEPRLTMTWNGEKIVDISREFLNSNGAEKHIDVSPLKPQSFVKKTAGSFTDNVKALVQDLNICSKRGLSERFDSTIGAGTVIMPFGGKTQRTPAQAMIQKISMEKKQTEDCSLMAFGYNPFISEKSPYHGAYLAVIESVSKLIAQGTDFQDVYLTFQEYFEKPGQDGTRWGKPFAALLGAFKAQIELGIGAIGGKDSMSGSFEKLDVPPTLVSFAVTTDKTSNIRTNEFKNAGSKICVLSPKYDDNGLPVTESLINLFSVVRGLLVTNQAVSCYTPGIGGIIEAVYKMSLGNNLGVKLNNSLSLDELFGYNYGSFVLEIPADQTPVGTVIGEVIDEYVISYNGETVSKEILDNLYENKLEKVFPINAKEPTDKLQKISYEAKNRIAPAIKVAKPRFIIPAFPGTNCEFDSAKAVEAAGGEAVIMVVNNLSSDGIKRSTEEFSKLVNDAQCIFIPGGFSGGDEPDGSGKFITAFFRNGNVKEAVTNLLDNRDGLMCGICNGFQALVKLGLVPYGKIVDTKEDDPTLTFNTIHRHQSKIVRTRIASNKSPWLSLMNVGDVVNVPISHGEGRFIANDKTLNELIANGQIATQYVDLNDEPTYDIQFNPNGSIMAIEGITSPDGRVFGKMGHSERISSNLYLNVPGEYDIKMFKSAVKYFN